MIIDPTHARRYEPGRGFTSAPSSVGEALGEVRPPPPPTTTGGAVIGSGGGDEPPTSLTFVNVHQPPPAQRPAHNLSEVELASEGQYGFKRFWRGRSELSGIGRDFDWRDMKRPGINEGRGALGVTTHRNATKFSRAMVARRAQPGGPPLGARPPDEPQRGAEPPGSQFSAVRLQQQPRPGHGGYL